MIHLIRSYRAHLKLTDPLTAFALLRGPVIRKNVHGIFMEVESDIQLKRLKEKEPETVEWIRTRMKPGEVFFDVGACVGGYSLLAASRGIEVCAFEPAFQNYYSLLRNILLNGLKIQTLPVAVSDTTTLTTLSYSSMERGTAHHEIQGANHNAKKSLSVISLSLDDAVKLLNIPQPDHLKIDTDGNEVAVLRGADETLQSVRTILMEIDESTGVHEKIKPYLTAFRLLSRFNKPKKDVYNALFERVA